MKSLLADITLTTLDRRFLPKGMTGYTDANQFDAVISSGLQCFGEIMKNW